LAFCGRVGEFFLQFLLLFGAQVVVVFRRCFQIPGRELLATGKQAFLTQTAFQAFAPAPQGLEDCLGTGSKAALECGKREAD
jgi:hypothetical protein